MTPDAVDRAARLLAAARLEKRSIGDLPDDCRPLTVADGYRVQDRLAELLGFDIGGWFCACTNREIQEKIGLSGPYCARLFSHVIHASPARLAPGDFPSSLVLECEFAFRLGHDLPARARPYTREEVAEAVASVHPSIEVVSGVFDDWLDKPIALIIADNGTDGALVHGDGVARWRDIDLAGVAVALAVNGRIVREGSGANVLGDPLEALAWLANARAGRGDGLAAGHIHNTGTCTSLYFAAPGDEAVADFGPLGEVRLSFTA